MSASKRKRATSCATRSKGARLSGAFCDFAIHELCDTLERTSLSSASTDVLYTYELLEQVLLNLNIQDLFVLQRTCKTWRDIVARSHALRKKMFLRKDGASLAASREDLPKWGDRDHPCYRDTLCFNPAADFEVKHGRPTGIKKWDGQTEAPMGFKFQPYIANLLVYSRFETWQTSTLFHADNNTWKTMFLTQPPVRTVRIILQIKDKVQPAQGPRKAGLRFGDLIWAGQKLVAEDDELFGGVAWADITLGLYLVLHKSSVHDKLKGCGRDGDDTAICTCVSMLQQY